MTDPLALKAWLDSTDHLYHCVGFFEGMACCLDALVTAVDQ